MPDVLPRDFDPRGLKVRHTETELTSTRPRSQHNMHLEWYQKTTPAALCDFSPNLRKRKKPAWPAMAVAIEPRHLRCTENWAHNIDLSLRYSITLIRIQHCLHGFQWILGVFAVYKSQVMHTAEWSRKRCNRERIRRQEMSRGYNDESMTIKKTSENPTAWLFARLQDHMCVNSTETERGAAGFS